MCLMISRAHMGPMRRTRPVNAGTNKSRHLSGAIRQQVDFQVADLIDAMQATPAKD